MDYINTIIEPVTTEKTTALQQNGQYVFKVSNSANKLQVKKMFELMYGTKVGNVQIMVVPRKTRLIKKGRVYTKRPVHKKAIITLKKGEKPIDIHKINLVTKKK